MLSAEDLAAVKVAVEVCCCPIVKSRIIRIPEKSKYDTGTLGQDSFKMQWDENVERTSSFILKRLGLRYCLQEKVLGYVHPIGVRMLIWSKYHERFLGISRNFSLDFLKSSLFTSRGIIDNKMAAEELINNSKDLSVKQRYKLACLYCFEDKISVLFKRMTKKDQKTFYNVERPRKISQPEIVTFWSYYINGEIKTLIGEENIAEYFLEKAIDCGSIAALEYWLAKTKSNVNNVIDAAEKVLKNHGRILSSYHILSNVINGDTDWIAFRNLRYDDSEDTWFPICFYADILFFLYCKMSVDQQVTLLRKDFINGSIILRCILDWPYTSHFMPTIELTWDFLPESNFVQHLLSICLKFESKIGKFWYGEEKTHSYRKLLMEFWSKSPKRFKKYVFSPKKTIHNDDAYLGLRNKLHRNWEFLGNFFLLNNFTHEDKKNFELILESATDDEKSSIVLSKGGESMCIELMKDNKWGRLDLFVTSCLFSQEQRLKFKRELSFTDKAKKMCIDFAGQGKWDATELFIRWSSLSDDEISRLKREMFRSPDCKRKCHNLILENDDTEIASKFCEWFSSTEEELRECKKEFAHSDFGVITCCILLFMGKLEQADKFVDGFLPSEEILEYRKSLAYRHGTLEYVFEQSVNLALDL